MRGVIVESGGSARGGVHRLACVVLVAMALAGCSLTMPFGDRSGAVQADPEITGSIAPREPVAPAMAPGQVSPFSPKLDEEDWRRQRAALATALDPQGNSGAVRWDNPDSGAKGSFAPIGNAFLIKHDICRVYVAMVAEKGAEEWFQGSACRVMPGEWQIRDIKPWKRPG